MPGNVYVADFVKVPAPSMVLPHVETARIELVGSALLMLVKMLSKMSDLVANDIVGESDCVDPAQHDSKSKFTKGARQWYLHSRT